jgi:putative selenate reductase FAD-binding subunit
MTEFFHRPTTVREALRLHRSHRGSAFLGGGTRLNCSETETRPDHYISLHDLGLDAIATKQGRLSLGAGVTLQRLVDDRRVPEALREAAARAAGRNVREMATLGGHVASLPPFSDLLPVLVALEAKVNLSGADAKSVALEDYAAHPIEGLVTALTLPRAARGRATASRAMRASAGARPFVVAAAALTVTGGKVGAPRIALGGVTRHAVRLHGVEEALAGRALPGLDELQALASRPVRPVASLAGGPAYLRYVAGVAVALALHAAWRRGEERR